MECFLIALILRSNSLDVYTCKVLHFVFLVHWSNIGRICFTTNVLMKHNRGLPGLSLSPWPMNQTVETFHFTSVSVAKFPTSRLHRLQLCEPIHQLCLDTSRERTLSWKARNQTGFSTHKHSSVFYLNSPFFWSYTWHTLIKLVQFDLSKKPTYLTCFLAQVFLLYKFCARCTSFLQSQVYWVSGILLQARMVKVKVKSTMPLRSVGGVLISLS